MSKGIHFALAVLVVSVGCTSVLASEADPYLGRWALTIPGGGAGWLGVTQENGYLAGSVLWGGGSVVPVSYVFVEDGKLYVLRLHEVKRKDAQGNDARPQMLPEVLVGNAYGDRMQLVQMQPHRDGIGMDQREFSGKRIPPLPDKPDLSKVKFGEPIQLFNGENLNGWELTNPRQTNGWSVQDGLLVNNPVQREGQRHISYGNLRTQDEFEDFNLKLEVNVDKGGNSGIYLRGIYEVQVAETYGRGVDSHHMGAVYSRITPRVSAEKPAGQWQTMDITLVDRHVTVKLNGTTIIDNEPLLGCTGGALWSDESRPGPIYLQGDHTAVKYRNIVLTPVVK